MSYRFYLFYFAMLKGSRFDKLKYRPGSIEALLACHLQPSFLTEHYGYYKIEGNTWEVRGKYYVATRHVYISSWTNLALLLTPESTGLP